MHKGTWNQVPATSSMPYLSTKVACLFRTRVGGRTEGEQPFCHSSILSRMLENFWQPGRVADTYLTFPFCLNTKAK